MSQLRSFLENDDGYNCNSIDSELRSIISEFETVKGKNKVSYYNIPCAFDIETSSFFRSTGNNKNEKVAIMYLWAFGIYGKVFVGRTWEQFVTLLNTVSEIMCLHQNLRLICYCHNLEFEFQFFRKWLEIEKVFAVDNRKPVYAITSLGIEFRCSLILSGYKLEKVAEHLHSYNIKKLVGSVDYSLIRHSTTPIKKETLQYQINDVRIVMAYIQECIESDGNIAKIPLTKTGYVRNYVRNNCFYENGIPVRRSLKKLRYHEFIKELTLEYEEYKQLKRAFQGGFTHANAFYVDKVVKNVHSFDFTSSYPYVMVSEKFPMSKAEYIPNISEDEFFKSLDLYCCLFDCEFANLRPVVEYENYISESRCLKGSSLDDFKVNNGRLISGSKVITTLTEIDFNIIEQLYTWDYIQVYNFRRYIKGYLPKPIIMSLLNLYKSKTELKGIEQFVAEYQASKERINAGYGMAVTDVLKEKLEYLDGEWVEGSTDAETALAKENNSNSRFMFYPWGVWITCYARRNLFTGICEFGGDYVYSDTDSIKVVNVDKHKDYINQYNAMVLERLHAVCDFYKIPFEMVKPKTIEGKEKILGVWDYEGMYTRFKPLRAKCYMVEKDGKINITVSGLNKKVAVPYLQSRYKNKIFENFTDGLYVPPEYTGKLTHTYIDDERIGYVKDYTGKMGYYREKSSIHLEKAHYNLSMSQEFCDYVQSLIK